MSGPRITRKVTVEVGKKVTESVVPSSVVQPSSSSSSSGNPRRSVFERLGPGAVDRPKTRDSYTPDKCRNWLRDGRCPYGNNCKFLHGPYTDPKPRTKSVRSIVHGGSKDRYDDADEKPHYHSRSFDSADIDDVDIIETPKIKRHHKSEEDLSDSPVKKTSKSKKKHKEEIEEDDESEVKVKRKRKTHRKKDTSPKPKAHSPDEDEEDYERPSKPVGDWDDSSYLDFERQLELERRRQDLQRQLALIDQEDAAASAEESEWKGKEKDDDRKVPIVHSKLHPDPSPSTTGGETPTQTVKKKKKKKTDPDGKKVKAKKDGASPRKKDETKRKTSLTGEEEEISRKEENIVKNKARKTITELIGSSDEDDLPEHQPMERDTRKISRHSDEVISIEHHDSPTRARPGERKRPENEQIRHKRDESKVVKDRRRVELSSDEARHVDDSHPRRPRNTSQEYYPSPDEEDDESRRVRSRVKRPSEGKRAEEEIAEDRGRHRSVEERVSSRGPRTPSPPPHAKDDRFYYEEQQEKRPPRGLPTRTPPREPTREDTMYGKNVRDDVVYRKDARGRPDDARGPRTPSDDEGRFSPPPGQGEAKGARYAERDRPPPRREPRERGPVAEQGDQRYPDRPGRGAMDTDYDRRKPREEDSNIRSRRPPDYPRTRDDEYVKQRGRDENYPRDEEFTRPREREQVKSDYQKTKYRDERVEDFPGKPRGRDDGEFTRGRGRDERDVEGRGPPQRDVHRRMHDDPVGHEREPRDDRGRPRSDYQDSRRDGRYAGAPDNDQYRRPAPSQPPPPRGRSPHRFDDRRRPDDGYRPGPRDPPGRGRAMGRGRAYTSPYDNRGKPIDTRRRSPPPPGPRSSFQDRDRGGPRGRDGPIGRGRSYVDKGRPPNDRYRDPNAPWDRRGDREYPPRDPGARDRRGRESPPPPPGFRDERVWEEKERRGSSPRSGSIPLQDRRGPFEHEQESKVRMGSRERHSLERGPPDWEYEDDPSKPLRKRSRPISGRLESPFDSKKPRAQSPISPDESPVTEDLPMEVGEPTRPKKPGLVAKDGKKIKKKKKDGKTSKAASITGGESVTEASADEGKIKGEKKLKKEKKLKEKGLKKKKKLSISALEGGQGDSVDVLPPPRLTDQNLAAEVTGAPKLGKKRRQVVSADGDKEAEKPKKKKKKKNQPEVLVQPWNDLEGEEEDDETMKVQDKLTDEGQPSKTQDEMFSDWSDDDSPVGEDSWPEESENSQKPTTDIHKDDSVTEAKELFTEDKVPSFDDVYDPISDDEFDAMYSQSDEEEMKKEEGATKPLGVEEVDWSSLGIAQDVNKDKEPLSHLERFTPSYVFSRIGISPTLAGQRITQLALDACTKSKEGQGIELFIPEEGPKCTGAFVAVAAAKKRDREALLGNLGPCRRALCARRDLAIRKHLGRTTKFGKISLFGASPTTPVDNELFQMSVALYKKDSAISDNSVRLIPSKVGSILLSQA